LACPWEHLSWQAMKMKDEQSAADGS
jgi:hypothetical protein